MVGFATGVTPYEVSAERSSFTSARSSAAISSATAPVRMVLSEKSTLPYLVLVGPLRPLPEVSTPYCSSVSPAVAMV